MTENIRFGSVINLKKLSITERSEAEKQANLCFKCMTGKHCARYCKSKLKCGIEGCERNHNRMLHNRQTVTYELIQSPDQTSETNLANETAWSVKGLLQVAPLRIYAEDGIFVETKAVCDTASSQTWIDEDLIQSLRLEGRNTSMSVTGVHGTNSIDCLKVPVKIGPANEVSDTIKIIASSYKDLVVGTWVYNVIELTLGQLRSLERRIAKNESLKMKYSDSIKKDLAKIYISLLEKGELERQDVWYLPHHPVVNPRKPIGPDGGDFLGNIGCSDDEDYLGENRKLIQAQGDNQQNANDVAASSQRKYSNSWLGSLMSQGNSRKDGVFGSAPVRQLSGPVSSNQGQHRPRVPPENELDAKTSFINSVASVRSSGIHGTICHSRKDVNETNLADPRSKVGLADSRRYTQSLTSVCKNGVTQNNYPFQDGTIRFRENCVALTADIEEKFLQIQVPEQQRRYLRFLWTDEDGKLMPYQYNRHVFGVKSSPTCANYTLQQFAKLFGLKHPIASQVIMDNFYVDDMLLSVHTIEQASKVIHDLKSLKDVNETNLADPRSKVGLADSRRYTQSLTSGCKNGVTQNNYPFQDGTISENNASYRKMFRHISEQLKALWKRWMSEYLPSLQRRAKWRTESGAEIKVGDLVWMVDEKDGYFN
ncbi:uncharacterized protein LOC142348070 [Convolutriloba macropyga]|uniref:uncharacterized protein LOC142348070 n=1 Tax=Convolutriloba macropyga TaxID=536237 RepID=UPI003F51EDB0